LYSSARQFVGSAKKKKKKKKGKKKAGGGGPAAQQSSPPRIGLSKIFPSGVYPEGEIVDYKDDNKWRTTSEEKRHLERLAQEDTTDSYQNIRRAAEVHRQVRQVC
jgi:methionyl aminopeptidase